MELNGLAFFEHFSDRNHALFRIDANDVADQEVAESWLVNKLIHDYAEEQRVLCELPVTL